MKTLLKLDFIAHGIFWWRLCVERKGFPSPEKQGVRTECKSPACSPKILCQYTTACEHQVPIIWYSVIFIEKFFHQNENWKTWKLGAMIDCFPARSAFVSNLFQTVQRDPVFLRRILCLDFCEYNVLYSVSNWASPNWMVTLTCGTGLYSISILLPWSHGISSISTLAKKLISKFGCLQKPVRKWA